MTAERQAGRALLLAVAVLSLALTLVFGLLWLRGGGGGETSLDITLETKGVLMAAVYKVYGKPEFQNQWTARTIVRNTGTAPARDLKISYKIVEYCDWSNSPIYPLVIPGQTVVDQFYPIISSKCTQLTSAAPIKLMMKCAYTDASGRERTVEKSARLEMRGRNEFLFTELDYAQDIMENFADFHMNDPLLAAWVTKDDPVVEQFLGIAQQIAGGAAAAAGDEQALKLMKSVWLLMAYNGISYQTPSGEAKKLSQIQHVKYPRDVLRNKSGTCIDLAIAYAAVLQSAGLQTLLVNIPGHCFPAVRLPGGNLVGVEATMLKGPGSAAAFEDAVKTGIKELSELKAGAFTIVDVQKIREAGITEPQLPEPAADALKAWGIANPLERETGAAAGGGQEEQPPVRREPSSSAGRGANMVPLSHPQGLFTMMVPSNWQPGSSPDGTTVGAQDPQGRAGVDVTVLADRAYQPGELQALVQQVFRRFSYNLPDITAVGSADVQLGGWPAVCIDTTFTFNGVPSRGWMVISVQNGRAVVLTTRAAASDYAAWMQTFNAIIASYRGGA
jgi:hypothetical protein